MASLLGENDTYLQQFIQSNYYASELFLSPKLSTSRYAKVAVAPIGMQCFINSAMTNRNRGSTVAHCDFVSSTLESTFNLLVCEDSNQYQKFEDALIGQDSVVHANVIDTLVHPTETEKEYIGIKHVTYQSLLNSDIAEEFILLETIGIAIDPNGRKFVFKCQRSVPLPSEYNIEATRENDYAYEYRAGNLHTMMLILSETSTHGALKMHLWMDVDITKDVYQAPIYGGFSTVHDASSLSCRYRNIIEGFSLAKKLNEHKPSYSLSTERSRSLSARSIEEVLSRQSEAFRQTSQFSMTNGPYFVSNMENGAPDITKSYGNTSIRIRDRQCNMCSKKMRLFYRKKKIHFCGICHISLCSSCVKPTVSKVWKELCSLCHMRNQCVVTAANLTDCRSTLRTKKQRETLHSNSTRTSFNGYQNYQDTRSRKLGKTSSFQGSWGKIKSQSVESLSGQTVITGSNDFDCSFSFDLEDALSFVDYDHPILESPVSIDEVEQDLDSNTIVMLG